ncbi:MAG: MHYT domain-containing protein [Candidatus Acidiferrales bacterium]
MSEIGAPLVGFYDYRLVALSIFIAMSASYMALDLGGRVTAARGWIRSAWLAGGAVAMGLGIWSMHFTGMLAFNLPVPVFYDWPTVLLSLLTAILSSAVALYVVSRKKMGRVQALTGSIFMGLGIAGMHYIGMAAMRLSAMCQYSPPLVVLSALIGVIASLVAIQLTFDYREDFRGTTPAKVMSAVVMGAAIIVMHYTGMWSASFLTTTAIPDMAHAVSVSSLGLSGIVLCTLVVQGAAIVTSSVDRWLARQAQELQTSERFRQIAESLEIVLALANANFTELLYVNRTYHDIWGRTLESFYAKPMSFLEGIHAEDRGRVAERVQRLIGGEPIDNLECRVVRPDGSISWIACRGYPIHDAQGHVYRLVGSAREITKRRQAEEALRSSEWEQRQLAEQLKGERARLVEAQEVAKIGSWEAELPSLNVIWSE